MSSSQVVLLTGGNSGLGYATVKALLDSSQRYHIILCGRSLEKATAAADSVKAEHPKSSSTIQPLALDITNDKSIQEAFQRVQASPGRVDVLLNNAGASYDMQIPSGELTTREAWQKTFDVNTIGPHITTETFMPLLLKSKNPRLIFISSGIGSLEITKSAQYAFVPVPPAGWPKPPRFSVLAYCCSKAALNMAMLDWYRQLTNDKVKVWAVNPGHLVTNLGGANPDLMRKNGAKDPSLGGNYVKDVIEGINDGEVGTMVGAEGVLPW
ncbi:hypothetical protein DL95DRAFT_345624 [Leptodontidium sp. 2 PMI_412]|nr:hypothetical protein DL95DRAFT_345624 [Leptodontidium sp. 2 PMI_412]